MVDKWTIQRISAKDISRHFTPFRFHEVTRVIQLASIPSQMETAAS